MARPSKNPKGNADSDGFRSEFSRVDVRTFEGFAVDATRLSKRFVIEVFLDGWPVKLLRANIFRAALRDAGYGDGCYGFSFSLSSEALEGKQLLTVSLANTGRMLAQSIELPQLPLAGIATVGEVIWNGFSHLAGWTRALASPAKEPKVYALIAGELVSEAQFAGWAQVADQNGESVLARRFRLSLPEQFVDGNAHLVRVVTDAGEELLGSPVAIMCFEDGLTGTLQRALAGTAHEVLVELIRRNAPTSVPFNWYDRWNARFRPQAPTDSKETSVAVALVGHGDSGLSLASLDQQTWSNWVAAVFPCTESQVRFGATDLADFLSSAGAGCDIVVLACMGTRFHADALAQICQAFAQFEDAVFAYPDVEILTSDGQLAPVFFPAFDYERFLEQAYCAYVFAVRRSRLIHVLERDSCSLLRLLHQLIESSAESQILHIPWPIALLPKLDIQTLGTELAAATTLHLARRGIDAKTAKTGSSVFPAIKVTQIQQRNPCVSVIIPTRDRVSSLKACVDSLFASDMRLVQEVLIVDNGSRAIETRAYLANLKDERVRVIGCSGEFNYAHLTNEAAALAKGRYLCLLNNDVEAITPTWLEELLDRMAETDVGAVSACLVRPSGVVQHGGVVLGTKFAAANAFEDCMIGDSGYSELLLVAHECSAVTAACLLARRDDFLSLDGLDAINFPINYSHVDFCLRLRATGKRIVFTPHARFIHHDAASRGNETNAWKDPRFQHELAALRRRWHEVLANDPYYSPALTLEDVPYSGLAWPPRSFAPRPVTFRPRVKG